MSEFISRYISHQPLQHGFIPYSDEENYVWKTLFERQHVLLPNRACDEFIHGLADLGLTAHAIPQLPEVNRQLYTHRT
jgi:phenylalanine-4-hydroxylase